MSEKRSPRLRILVVSVLAMAILGGCDSRPRVLLLAREASSDLAFMIKSEVRPMIAALEKAGYEVVIASDRGSPISSGAERLVPAKKTADVDITKYAGLVIPCMASGGVSGAMSDASIALAGAAIAANIPIAAQYSGVDILARARNPVDRKLARSYSVVSRDVGLVVDGNVATSGTCPNMARYGSGIDGTAKLMEAFVALLSKR